MDENIEDLGMRRKVKLWHVIAVVGFSGLITANYLHWQEWNSPAPAFAGRLCDKVWAETRKGNPTVRWYHACVRQAALTLEQQDAP